MNNKIIGHTMNFLSDCTADSNVNDCASDCAAENDDQRIQNGTDKILNSAGESYMFKRMRIEKEKYRIKYYITSTREYDPVSHKFKKNTIEQVFDFAYKMSFGGKGQHRSYRSGGSKHRQNYEIFVDAFQGKLAECALFNIIYKLPGVEKPDFSVTGQGEWDDVDLKVCGKTISVKSTKHFGQLMLLEESDWDEYGTYIPNEKKYDYLALVRIRPSCEQLMKNAGVFQTNEVSYEWLRDSVCSQKWDYDYAGYISLNELKYIISNKYVLPKGALLNDKIEMDASNYYIQAGDMHKITGDDWIQQTEE